MRRVRILLFLLLPVLALLALLAPTLAGTIGPVREWIRGRAEEQVGRRLRFGSIELGWTSGAEITGLAVADERGDFSASILEAESVRLETPLTKLVLGGGDLVVAVRGAKVRLRERDGATSADDLIERFGRDSGRGEAEEPARLELKLEGCSVAVESDRLYALEGAAGFLRVQGDRLSGEFHARALVDGRGGDCRATVEGEGGSIRGTIRGTGLDLRAARADLAGACEVDLRADLPKGGARRIEIAASGRDLRFPGVEEPLLTLEAKLSPGDASVEVESFRIGTASKRLSLEGSGDLPFRPRQGRSSLRLRGEADLAFLFGLLGEAPCDGRLGIDLVGESDGRTLVVRGGAGAGDLLFRAPDLRRQGARSVDAKLDLALDLESRSLEIRSLRAEVSGSKLELSGSGRLASAPEFALSGSIEADLDEAFRFAQPALGLAPGASVGGRAVIALRSLSRKATGDVDLDAGAEIERLRLAGLFAEEVRRERLSLEIDLGLRGEGDRLLVRRGRLDGLEGGAELSGLRGGRPRLLGATARGTAEIDPLLLRLAGLAEVETASGSITLSLDSEAQDDGVRLSGRVEAKQLRLSTPRFAFTRERILLEGSATDGPRGISGAATLFTGDLRVEARSFGPDGAEGSYRIDDAAALLREIAPFVPLGGTEVSGAFAGTFLAQRSGEAWNGSVRAESPRAGVRAGGFTLPPTPLAAEILAIRSPRGLSFPRAELTLPEYETSVVARGTPDLFDIDLGLALERCAPLHPSAEALAPEGRLALRGTLARGAVTTFLGRLGIEPFSVSTGERACRSRFLRLPLDLRLAEGGAFEMRPARLELDFGSATLGGRYEPGRLLSLDFLGDVALEGLLLGGERGDVRIEARASLPLGDDRGSGSAFGLLTSAGVRSNEVAISGARAEFRLELAAASARGRPLDLRFHARCDELRVDTQTLEGVEATQSVVGDWSEAGRREGFRLEGEVGARMLRLDALPIRGVAGHLEGLWRSPDLDDLSGLSAEGGVSFESAATNSITLSNGKARLALEGRRARVTDLSAQCNGGTVGGEGAAEFRGDAIVWEGVLDFQRVGVDESLGRPLSFLVPILRLKSGRGGGERLTGMLSGDVHLAADGATGSALRRSLVGEGRIRLGDVVVRDSLLLPLLTLRLDRALLGAPFRFRDLDLAFRVADGRVRCDPLRIAGEPFSLEIEGSAGLDGSLDYLVRGRLLPIPLRVRGSFDDPKVAPHLKGIFR